jgi:hypothetical protein
MGAPIAAVPVKKIEPGPLLFIVASFEPPPPQAVSHRQTASETMALRLNKRLCMIGLNSRAPK